VRFTAPGTGRVAAVEAGEMHQLNRFVVELAGDDAIEFPSFREQDLPGLGGDAMRALLLEAGEWVSLRKRPFGGVADPGREPSAIFVRAMNSEPLAADPSLLVAERREAFLLGVKALLQLGDGPVFVCARASAELPLADSPRLRRVDFAGPHPTGLVGTHIHHLAPVSEGGEVWYVGAQEVLAIGHLVRTGRVNPERVISLAGPMVERPRLLRTRLGASSEDLLRGELLPGKCRVISGSVLAGRRASGSAGYLGRYHEQLCAFPEIAEEPSRAWFVPGLPGGHRAPPWSASPHWATSLNGKRAALLPLDVFERVVPLRLPVSLLLRSLAAGQIRAAKELGALQLEEEDLALCSFLCPSKIEYGSLLRSLLREVEAERT
jgi:Na+-transporting NADH:ubiquinone oxidoreductase subunit A